MTVKKNLVIGTPLGIIRQLDSVDLWVFLVLRSMCGASGELRLNNNKSMLGEVAKMVSGRRDKGITLAPNAAAVEMRLRRLAYYQIIEQKKDAKIDEILHRAEYRKPVTFRKVYLDLVPDPAGKVTQDMMAEMEQQYRDSEAAVATLRKEVLSLKRKIKVVKSEVVTKFKLANNDGSENTQGVEAQRIWSWFILLGIEDAYTRVQDIEVVDKTTKQISFTTEKVIDFKKLSPQIAMFSADVMEGVLLQMLTSRRLDQIVEESGDKWRDAVYRYLYAAFKGEKAKKRPEDRKTKREFRPLDDI